MNDRRYLWPAILVAAVALGIAIPALAFATGIGRAARETALLETTARSWGVDWTPGATGATATRARAAASLARVVAGAGVVALVIAALSLWAISATRADARRGEWTVHRALGASRRTLIRRGLGDGATAATAAVLLGCAIGAAAIGVMTLTWPGAQRWSEGALEGAALTAAVPIACWMLLLAVAPFLTLRTNANLAGPPVARRGLVVPGVQLGVVLAVLLAAGRLAGPHAIEPADSPDASNGVVYRIATPQGRTAPERAALYGSLLDTLIDDPSVGAAAVASPGIVLGLGTTDLAITDCGACWQGGLPAPFHPVAAGYYLVSPDTFEAAGIPIVAGRGIRRDESGAEPVAIVSRALAERHFERGSAVGRRIRVGKSPGEWHLVVGVAENREPEGLGAMAAPYAVYLSAFQYPATELELLVSAEADGSAVRRAVADILGPAAASGEPITFTALREAAARPTRWLAVALGVEGGIVLLLASYGVAVVATLTANRRRSEYALRRAVGARRGDIRRLAYGETGRAVLLGLAIGWWLDLLAAGLIASAAGPETTLSAPVTMGFVTVLAASAFAGASGPTRRAVAVTPCAALEPGTS